MNPPILALDRLARWLGYVPPRLTPSASERLARVVEGVGLRCTCQRLRAAGWKVVSCPACSSGLPAASIGIGSPRAHTQVPDPLPDAEGAARRPERAEARS